MAHKPWFLKTLVLGAATVQPQQPRNTSHYWSIYQDEILAWHWPRQQTYGTKLVFKKFIQVKTSKTVLLGYQVFCHHIERLLGAEYAIFVVN